jgi:hypothetical protein
MNKPVSLAPSKRAYPVGSHLDAERTFKAIQTEKGANSAYLGTIVVSYTATLLHDLAGGNGIHASVGIKLA